MQQRGGRLHSLRQAFADVEPMATVVVVPGHFWHSALGWVGVPPADQNPTTQGVHPVPPVPAPHWLPPVDQGRRRHAGAEHTRVGFLRDEHHC